MTKVIINKIFPVKGFSAITIWPFIFARHELSQKTFRHERMHYRRAFIQNLKRVAIHGTRFKYITNSGV